MTQEIDDILANLEAGRKKPKKVHSGDKGDRTERNLCKLLSARFGRPFERSVGSGNRWSQVAEMPAHARETLLGDLCCPEGFLWVVECKGGYEGKVDFHSVFETGNRMIDDFCEQSDANAARTGKLPLLVYKRNFRQWLAFVRTDHLPGIGFDYSLTYRDWTCVALERLLEAPDHCFFAPT